MGHSERRSNHSETNDVVRLKASAAQASNLITIICIGETSEERDAGDTSNVIIKQLSHSIPSEASFANTVIAYEPIWAIGTGVTPNYNEIQDTHSIIRTRLGELLSSSDAEKTRLIYGGSVTPKNAPELLTLKDVDGALVGGASLNWEDFWAIAKSCPA